MDERARRLWAGTEAGAIGYGGVAAVARATGMAISTVRKGRDEARAGARPGDVVKVRRSAGKRPYEAAHPEVWPALEKLVDPITRGDPESPLRWTCQSTHVLSSEMFVQHGVRISDKTVAKLLREHGVQPPGSEQICRGRAAPLTGTRSSSTSAPRLRTVSRVRARAGGSPSTRRRRNSSATSQNRGQEWQPQGEPELVDVHDFPDDAVGKAIPSRGVLTSPPTTASSAWAPTTTRPSSRWCPSRRGGNRWVRSATPTPGRGSSSPPTPEAAMAIALTCGSTNSSGSPTSSACRSASAIYAAGVADDEDLGRSASVADLEELAPQVDGSDRQGARSRRQPHQSTPRARGRLASYEMLGWTRRKCRGDRR